MKDRGVGHEWLIGRRSRRVAAAAAACAVMAATQLLAPSLAGAQEGTYTQSPLPTLTAEELVGIDVDTTGNVYIVDNTLNKASALNTGAGGWGVVTSDLNRPWGAAVDKDGNLFVGDLDNRRILKFVGGGGPAVVVLDDMPAAAIDVDDAGALYFTAHTTLQDHPNPIEGVFKLDPGASTPVKLPFPDMAFGGGIAVGRDGTIYVGDLMGAKVFKLDSGAGTPVVLPFTNLADQVVGVDVDKDGNVYAATFDQVDTGRNKVAKLAPGATESVALPVSGIKVPGDIAVVDNGSIYITNMEYSGVSSSVLVLTPEATTEPELCTGSLCGFGS